MHRADPNLEIARLREQLLLAHAEADAQSAAFAAAELQWAAGNLQFAVAMVETLDARDSYTAGHSAAVATYTRDIAHNSGMTSHQCDRAHLAGLLHDIGKIGVRDEVLNKPGRLTSPEVAEIQTHPVIGANILGMVDAFADLARIVRHHHERIDGRGYPDGLRGIEIPETSRMIAVADTYSALTTNRPYREGVPTSVAMSILEQSADNGQLDPKFTEVFLIALGRSSDAYHRGNMDTFAVQAAQHRALGLTDLFTTASQRGSRFDVDLTRPIELLVDESIVLRTLQDEHAAARCELLASDQGDIHEWTEWATHPTLEKSRAYIERSWGHQQGERDIHLGIFVDGTLAGEIVAATLDEDEPTLGYWLHHTYQRRGIMTRAVWRFSDWLFANLGVDALYADPTAEHTRSCSVLERLGFAPDRVEERYEMVHGSWQNAMIYKVTAQRWYQLHTQTQIDKAA